jgi:hypothetical protein
MNAKKLSIFLFALASITTTAYFLSNKSESNKVIEKINISDSKAPATIEQNRAEEIKTASSEAKILSASNLNSDSKPISAQLISRYNDGKNMRSFVDFALQHPEMGGNYYAAKVLTQCRGFSSSADVNSKSITASNNLDGNTQAAMASAAEKLQARCADFLPNEISSKRDREILEEGKKKGDPLILASNSYLASFSEKGEAGMTQRKTALSKVLELQDPAIFEDLGTRLVMAEDPKSGQRGYFVDNKFYGLNDPTDVGHAVYLLPCGVGLECGNSSFDIASRCESGSGCFADRFAYIKDLYAENREGYQRVISLYENLVQNVKQKNSDSFIQNKK